LSELERCALFSSEDYLAFVVLMSER